MHHGYTNHFPWKEQKNKWKNRRNFSGRVKRLKPRVFGQIFWCPNGAPVCKIVMRYKWEKKKMHTTRLSRLQTVNGMDHWKRGNTGWILQIDDTELFRHECAVNLWDGSSLRWVFFTVGRIFWMELRLQHCLKLCSWRFFNRSNFSFLPFDNYDASSWYL